MSKSLPSSVIAGQDLKSHDGSEARITNIVRTWLFQQSKRQDIPGHLRIQIAFDSFYGELPDLCNAAGIDDDEISYPDFVYLAQQWLILQNAASAT